MNGILLVDKPLTWTSFDVVNYLRRMIANHEGKRPKQVKVGHTGTLDPLATGLLVVLVGNYTKRADQLMKLDKTYEVTMKLGETSTTGDGEGQKSSISMLQPTAKDIEAQVLNFTGQMLQTPPRYSAIKVGGQRAYKLARAGQEVQLEARPITVHSMRLINYKYPEVDFIAEVSSGTYIRVLVEDMGVALKTGAYMSSLRRSAVGPFDLKDALDIKSISADKLEQSLISLPSALAA